MEPITLEKDLHIEDLKMKKAALVLRAVNHPLRQQILQLLHHNEKMTVTDIYERLGLEQSVASQHLAILRTPGIVSTKRDSKYVFYSVNCERLEQIHSIARQLIG
jgi:DNA-binding transcriptional ArsR family regulator